MRKIFLSSVKGEESKGPGTFGHLAIADRSQTSSVKEESRSLGASIRSIFNGTERQTPSSNNPAIGAATALVWLTPITMLFVVPTWLVRRKSRTETA